MIVCNICNIEKSDDFFYKHTRQCNGEFNYGWDIDHKIHLSSANNEE
jgi:hypothetical protein